VLPFVCGSDPSFSEKLEAGWQGTETQQIYLQSDGALNPENEFDRQLKHQCDWVAPGGDGGEAAATPDRSPALCTESDRSATTLEIADVSDPSDPKTVHTTTCKAYHYNKTYAPDISGVISDEIGIDLGDGLERVILLSHCWTQDESFPAQVAASGAAGVCPKETMAVTVLTSQTQVLATAGTWTLSNGPALPGGGHHIAEVDLTLGSPGSGAPAYTVKGHIDLPIVKVNVGGKP
jgi:hypothetical protein